MENMDPHIKVLIECIELEEKEEALRYNLAENTSLKMLKADGLAIHPISIKGRSYGFADYPEFSFKIPYPTDTGKFKGSSAIELFVQGEVPIKGVLLSIEGSKGEVRIYAPEFPDWLEEEGVGIKLAPDTKTAERMKKGLTELPVRKRSYELFKRIHSEGLIPSFHSENQKIDRFFNGSLNESQKNAVRNIIATTELTVLHGPHGTGKTTTIIEAIRQLATSGKKILVSAPSNAAVDHIARGLINSGLNYLRIGNNTKVSEDIFPYTMEGKLNDTKFQKEIKKMKKESSVRYC
jgi:hypothetical protein